MTTMTHDDDEEEDKEEEEEDKVPPDNGHTMTTTMTTQTTTTTHKRPPDNGHTDKVPRTYGRRKSRAGPKKKTRKVGLALRVPCVLIFFIFTIVDCMRFLF